MIPSQYLAAAIDEDRHRGEAQRHAHQRALDETRLARPALTAGLLASLKRLVRRNGRLLTDFECRLPDGTIGRTAVVLNGGEWTLVCRVA